MRGAMSLMLMIRCPVDNTTTSTGLLLDEEGLRKLRGLNSPIHCRACGCTHQWHGTEAWLAKVVTPFQPIPASERRTIPADGAP